MIKVERSQPAPASLALEAQKKDGDYNKPDVIERLWQDFHNKCYICGTAELQDGVVEHRLPHKNGKFHDRKFDWDNLFWSCRHCNGVKNRGIYDEGIIDCCRRDPEDLLEFKLMENNVSVAPVNPSDSESALTAALIYDVFNRRNTGMRDIQSADRLRWLLQEMNGFYRNFEKYRKQPGNRHNQRMMQACLVRDSAFAEFKRAYVRKRLDKFPELGEYLR